MWLLMVVLAHIVRMIKVVMWQSGPMVMVLKGLLRVFLVEVGTKEQRH